MRFWHPLVIFWFGGLLVELTTNPEHIQHEEEGVCCIYYIALCASMLAMLVFIFGRRFGYFSAPPVQPLRRDPPRPTPPPLTGTPVPAERYVFLATNDPNVDLQPKGRDRG